LSEEHAADLQQAVSVMLPFLSPVLMRDEVGLHDPFPFCPVCKIVRRTRRKFSTSDFNYQAFLSVKVFQPDNK
jgi:hypothetical protein